MTEHDQETTVFYKAIADFSSLYKEVDKAKAKVAELRAAEAKANAQSLAEQEFLSAARGGHAKDLDSVSKKLSNYKQLLADVSAAESKLGNKQALSSLVGEVEKLNAKLADTKKLLAAAHEPAPPGSAVSSGAGSDADAAKIKKVAEATTAAAVANIAYAQSSKAAHAARAQESKDLDKLAASLTAYAAARWSANAADRASSGFKVPTGVKDAFTAYTNLNSVLKETDNLLGKVSRRKNFAPSFQAANASTPKATNESTEVSLFTPRAGSDLVSNSQTRAATASAAAMAAEKVAADAAAKAYLRYAAAKAAAAAAGRAFTASANGEINELRDLPKYYIGGAQAAERFLTAHISLSHTFAAMPALTRALSRDGKDLVKVLDQQSSSSDRAGRSFRATSGIFGAFRTLLGSFGRLFGSLFDGLFKFNREGTRGRGIFSGLGGAFRGVRDAAEGLAGAFKRIFTEGEKLAATGASLLSWGRGFSGGLRQVGNLLVDVAGSMGKLLTKSTEFLNFGWKAPLALIIPLLAALIAGINPVITMFGAAAGATIGFGSALSNLASIAVALPGILSAVGAAVGGIYGAMQGIIGGAGGGIIAAYMSGKNAQLSAGGGGGGSSAGPSQAQQVSDAQENLAKAKLDLSRAYIDTQRKIADAEKAVTRAQENATKAQKDLNAARKQARLDLIALELEVSRAAMNELGAQAAVDKSKENLANVLADPNSTKGDKEEARYQLEQAQANQHDTIAQDKANRQKLAQEKKAGLEQDPNVVAARQQLADARQQLADAKQQLLRDKQDAPFTIYDAKKAVRDAQNSVTNARNGSGSGGGGGRDPFATFNALMKELSPSAQKVVKALIDMGPAWKSMRQGVQEKFFSQIVGDMGKLKDLIPVIGNLWGTGAKSLGKFVHNALSLLDSKSWKSDLGEISKLNGQVLDAMGRGVLSLAGAFKDIIIAAGPFTTWLVGKLADGAKHFADMVGTARKDGSLAAWLKSTETPLSNLWTIIKNIGGTLWNYLQAASGFGKDVLTALMSVTGGWLKRSEDARKKGSPFREWLKDIEPLLTAIGHLFGTLAKWFEKVVSDPKNIRNATKILNDFTDKFGPAIGKLLDTLGKSGLFDKLIVVAGKLSDVITLVMKNGGIQLFNAIDDMLSGILDFLAKLGDNPFGGIIVLVAAIVGFVAITHLGSTLRLVWTVFSGLAKLTFGGITKLIDKLLMLFKINPPKWTRNPDGPNSFTDGGPNTPKGPAGSPAGASPEAAKTADRSAPGGYKTSGWDENGNPIFVKKSALKNAVEGNVRAPSDPTSPAAMQRAISRAKAAGGSTYEFVGWNPETGRALYIPKDGLGRPNVFRGPGALGPTDGSLPTRSQMRALRDATPKGLTPAGFDPETGAPLFSDATAAQEKAARRAAPRGSQYIGRDPETGAPRFQRTQPFFEKISFGDGSSRRVRTGPAADIGDLSVARAGEDVGRFARLGRVLEPVLDGLRTFGRLLGRLGALAGAVDLLASAFGRLAAPVATAVSKVGSGAMSLLGRIFGRGPKPPTGGDGERITRGLSLNDEPWWFDAAENPDNARPAPLSERELRARYRANLRTFRGSQLGRSSASAYRTAVQADPRLRAVNVRYPANPGEVFGGQASAETGEFPLLEVNKRRGVESLESFRDQFISQPGHADEFSRLLGVPAEKITPQMLAKFVPLHELGHAQEFLDRNLTDINRERIEDRAGVNAAPTRRLKNIAYRAQRGEAYADEFATRLLPSVKDGPLARLRGGVASVFDALRPQPTTDALVARRIGTLTSGLSPAGDAGAGLVGGGLLSRLIPGSIKNAVGSGLDLLKGTPVGKLVTSVAKSPVGRFLGKALPVIGTGLSAIDLASEWSNSLKNDKGEKALGRRLQGNKLDGGALGEVFKSMGLAGLNDAIDGATIGANFGPAGAVIGGAVGLGSGLVRGAGNAVGFDAVFNNGKKGSKSQGIFNGNSWMAGLQQMGDFAGGIGSGLFGGGGKGGKGKGLFGDIGSGLFGGGGKGGKGAGMFGDMAKGLGDFFKPAAQGITKVWGSVVKPLQTFANGVNKIWQSQVIRPFNAFVAMIGRVWRTAVAGWGKIFATLGKWFNDHVVKPAQRMWSRFSAWFNDHVIKPAVRMWNRFSAWFSDHVIKPAQKVFKNVHDWFDDLIKNIVKIFNKVHDWFYDNVIKPAQKVFQNVHDWFNDAVKAFQTWVKGLGNLFHDWILKPFNDFATGVGGDFNSWILKPFNDFITALGDDVYNWILKPFNDVINTIGGIFNGFNPGDWLTNAFNSVLPTAHPASGGLITSAGRLETEYHAAGGRAGMFNPKGTDTVPAMLTPGEFVLRKAVVDALGVNRLQKLNSGNIQMSDLMGKSNAAHFFAYGGLVPPGGVGRLPGFRLSSQDIQGAVVSSTVHNDGITINELVVNNPVPEQGSVSIARKLRGMAYYGSTGK